jgi:hypothetical protein
LCWLAAWGCASSKEETRPAPVPEQSETVTSDAPPSTQVPVVPDPSPSTVVVHVTILQEAIQAQLEENIPRTGAGETRVFSKVVPYKWSRGPVTVKFDRGRLVLNTTVTGVVNLLGENVFPILLNVAGEPIITADYQARLQSVEVTVNAQGSLERANKAINESLTTLLTDQLNSFRLDVRPMLLGAYQRIASPMPLPAPVDNACALLKIVSIQAGPTVLAGGVEKDFGVVVMPSVTMPCETTVEAAPAPLPPLANVASLPSGPFMVTVPVAAQYEEISWAMEKAMGGKLHFSRENPGLYLEKPQVYSSNEALVIKINLGGWAQTGPVRTNVGGELFLKGHPTVVDNQIIVQDLELTSGSSSSLLKLKFAMDRQAIRDAAQQAIRLDLSERLNTARDKMSRELSFEEGKGCVQASVLRTEVTGIHPHKGFLRIYVQTWAQLNLYMPCPGKAEAPSVDAGKTEIPAADAGRD